MDVLNDLSKINIDVLCIGQRCKTMYFAYYYVKPLTVCLDESAGGWALIRQTDGNQSFGYSNVIEKQRRGASGRRGFQKQKAATKMETENSIEIVSV